MTKAILVFGATLALLTTASLTNAARDPSDVYASELQDVKLQFPDSSDELCESDSSYPDCIGFRDSSVWWMQDSNDFVVHKINDTDPHRNELRNKKEFNMLSTNETFSGTLSKVAASSFKHVTVLQLHRSVKGSKPLMRIQYDRSNDRYEMEVARDENASNGYCKEVFSTSGSGDKFFSISLSGSSSSRTINANIGGQTHSCDVSDWPSGSDYYYKMGTYLSDGDGSAEWKFKNWDWNQ